jgi:hypothetical protein
MIPMRRLPRASEVTSAIFGWDAATDTELSAKQRLRLVRARMRTRPAIMAGIAASAGLAFGLISRYASNRSLRRIDA